MRKTLTGIKGMDEITQGGLPTGRTTLICGQAGSGKSIFGLEFLAKGILNYNENGVVVSFEENEDDILTNTASFGWDLPGLIEQKKLAIEYVYIERSEIEETGMFSMDGLLIRIAAAIDEVGAKRVLIDTIESLFSGFISEGILRAEIRRLFRWLKDKGVTTVLTAEMGTDTLTRFGLEEYLSDCVIVLDHRIHNQVSRRRLRVLKYRGTSHGTNEYPFMITNTGYSVLPITSVQLNFEVGSEWFKTGIDRLDSMFGEKGLYRGSAVLVSGSSGTGKSSILATIVDAACRRGEKCCYISFEESPSQLKRDFNSIGIDLAQWEDNGLLHFHSARSTSYGLEMHLLMITELVDQINPDFVVMDPVSNLSKITNSTEASNWVVLLIDFLKSKKITCVFSELTHIGDDLEATSTDISSMMDTWLLLRDIELYGERNKAIYILKSRGMGHSNQIREFKFTNDGIKILDVYVGTEGVLTGTARIVQEQKDQVRKQEAEREVIALKADLVRREEVLDNQIKALRLDYEAEKRKLIVSISNKEKDIRTKKDASTKMGNLRGMDMVSELTSNLEPNKS